jgi:hypothetical protein
MNRFINYSLQVVVLTLLLGCTKEQQNLFPETAAVRLNNAIDEIDNTLTDAPDGWLMQYFATSESPGYSLLVRFSVNGEVVVAAKNELLKSRYVEAKSGYDVIGDNGPVLSFNTYNNALHLFSNPVNPDGVGLAGDYEFIVSSYSDSLISLKGKKSGTEILMTRLSEGFGWEDYFAQLDKMDRDLFGDDPLYFISGRDTLLALNGDSHIISLQGRYASSSVELPLIITQNGLRFYKPFVTSSKSEVQWFTLNKEGTKLIADNNKGVYFAGVDLVSFIINNQATYVFDTTQMSNHFIAPLRELVVQMKDQYKGKRNIDFIALSYKPGLGSSFNFSTQPTITAANFKISLGSVAYSPDVITIEQKAGEFDHNGEIFYSSVGAIETMWKELNGSYMLNSSPSKNEIRFVDINYENRFFVVKKR